jgi:hypothetical protein
MSFSKDPLPPTITLPPDAFIVSPGVLQRDRRDEAKDPWDNLEPAYRKEVEELYDDCKSLIGWLARANKAS